MCQIQLHQVKNSSSIKRGLTAYIQAFSKLDLAPKNNESLSQCITYLWLRLATFLGLISLLYMVKKSVGSVGCSPVTSWKAVVAM